MWTKVKNYTYNAFNKQTIEIKNVQLILHTQK